MRDLNRPLNRLQLLAFAMALLVASVLSGCSAGTPDRETLTIDQETDSEVFVVGKDVVVESAAKGVLALGGDITVKGRVSGDVATIGGSVIQASGAYIGGDVIIFGGRYLPADTNPQREDGKETIMYAGYEEELREMVTNPAGIFTPDLSWSFLAQRLLSILFWFVISFGLTTIAPGAVGRSISRLRLRPLRITAIGFVGIVATTAAVAVSLAVMPSFLGTVIGLMAFSLLVLSYVFGRVALQLAIGKRVLKWFVPDKGVSEAVTTLVGVVVVALILSLPFIWMLATVLILSASIGTVLTARAANGWSAG